MPKHHISRFSLVFALVIALSGCAKADPSKSEFALGTVCSVTLYNEAKAKLYQAVFSRFREIENRMSVNLADSDISRVNASAGRAPVVVAPDVFEVVERALHFAEISDGAFDPTVGPLVSLWGIGGENPRLPSQAEIDAVLPLISWRDVELDRENRGVFLKKPGMALDLGAIAKGYAADEAAAILEKAGIRQAIIDLGGNVLTFGAKRDGTAWNVGIQNPVDERGSYIGIVRGRAHAMVTSGVYERYFEADGVHYHHIFSSSDGYPVSNKLLSVTIISAGSMDADALSTAVFVMGYEKGRAFIESLPETEAIFVFDDMSVRATSGADFILTDDNFTLLP